MVQENINWLIHPTGDPFSDIGGLVIEYLQEKWPEKSIMNLVEEVTHIYVKRWDNNLHVFFLNSKITHSSSKGQKGIDNTLAYYRSLFEGKDARQGYCRITGQKGAVFLGGRNNHIMSGSGEFINFHHGFEGGIMLSKEALVRMLFVPLGVEQLGDKVAVILSNNLEVTRYFVRNNVDNNIRDMASDLSTSILKSEFSNPTNVLFEYAGRCIQDVRSATFDKKTNRSNTKGVTLNLFHFTNYRANPSIDLYTLPAIIFAFYARCILDHKRDWQNFVYRYYSNSKFKNARYDEGLNKWITTKEEVNYQMFKVWNNKVFYFLLRGESLLPLFLQHSKYFLFSFEIVELYQINIRNMEKKALDKIKKMADFIVSNRSDDEIKRTMIQLLKAKKSNELRHFLILLLRKNYEEENMEPLFTLEDYLEYLFPDGSYWMDVKDLLLIAIYQKLHETDKRVALELAEIEQDVE